MLSDAMNSCGDRINDKDLAVLANGCLTPSHATQFLAFVRQIRNQFSIGKIMSGQQRWPDKPEDRDVLYFLAQSFRARLVKELPRNRGKLTGESKLLAMNAKSLLIELANISLEIAQMVVSSDDGDTLPADHIFPLADRCCSLWIKVNVRCTRDISPVIFCHGIVIVAVDPADVDKTMEAMKSAGDTPYVVGTIEAGEKGVTLC